MALVVLSVGLIFVLLGIAAWRDFATRTIPDAISLGILLVGASMRLSEGWAALATSALTALALFVLLLPLHARGLLGGGDIKLLAALAFGLSPLASYQLLSAVILAGGVLALVYVALRQLARSGRAPGHALRHRLAAHRIIAIEFWRIRKGAPLPYGIAIAAGAALVIGHQGG